MMSMIVSYRAIRGVWSQGSACTRRTLQDSNDVGRSRESLPETFQFERIFV